MDSLFAFNEIVLLDQTDLPPRNMLLDVAPAPTRDLVESISQYGIVDPITVVLDKDGPAGYSTLTGKTYERGWKYYPVAGHRRTLSIYAIQDLDENFSIKIPAIVLEGLSIVDAIRVIYHAENLKTENKLINMEIGRAILANENLSADDPRALEVLCKKLSVDKTTGKKLIQLIALNTIVIGAYKEGKMSMGTLAKVVKIKSPKAIQKVVDLIATNEQVTAEMVDNVRHSEQIVEVAKVNTNMASLFEQPLSQYVSISRDRLTRWAGWIEDLDALKLEIESFLQSC